MKHILLISMVLFAAQYATKAQWSVDPENPMTVAQLDCNQQGARMAADGDGGVFVFWLDTRNVCNNNGPAAVYGQHYDFSGNKLWETDGRLIASYVSTIKSVAVQRSSDGEMILGFHTGFESFGDSLKFQKYDDDGNALWNEDLLIARADGCAGFYMLGIEDFSFLRNQNGEYTVNFSPVYCGGSNGNRITRFNSNGELTGPFNGEPESNQYYIGSRGIAPTYDGTNEVYLYHTGGNGAGAHAFCMRVEADGDSAWAPIDVLEGTNGLNYQYGAISDPDGITFCYMSNGPTNTVDIYMRRLNADGSWAWNGNTTAVCEFEGGQSNFHMVRNDEYIYVVWADGRPGVIGYSAIYGQKIDIATGAVQWLEDGVEIFDQNTYIPYPKCALDGDGNLVVMNESTMTDAYFNALLVDPSGSILWSEFVSIGGYSFSPFYQQYQMMNSNGNMIVVWDRSNPSGGADGVYIARIQEPDMTTYISETVTACDSYSVNEQTFTSDGIYEITLPGDTVLTLDLTINSVDAQASFDGSTISALNTSGFFFYLNCDTDLIVADDSDSYTPDITGNYALIVSENNCSDTTECFYVNVIGMEEIQGDNILLFPNPGNDLLNIVVPDGMSNITLQMSNTSGDVVILLQNFSSKIIPIDTSVLAAGVYYISLIQDENLLNTRWIKME